MYTKMKACDEKGEYWIILDPEGKSIASVSNEDHTDSLLFHLNR